MTNNKTAILALADGSVYQGYDFGAETESCGEVVFNTSMAGYQEILTDPSYAGQIVMPTYPLIGNYGTNQQDIESRQIQVRGFIVREKCDQPSHYLNDKYQELVRCRMEGYRTEPHYSHTMIGLKRMDNIQKCAFNIFKDNVPGDFVETGVWMGGAVIFMSALLKIFSEEERNVWAADSFEGLPPPQVVQDNGYDFSKIETFLVSDPPKSIYDSNDLDPYLGEIITGGRTNISPPLDDCPFFCMVTLENLVIMMH